MIGVLKVPTPSLFGAAAALFSCFSHVFRLNSVLPKFIQSAPRQRGCRRSPTSMNDRRSGTNSRLLQEPISTPIRTHPNPLTVVRRPLLDVTEAYSALAFPDEQRKGATARRPKQSDIAPCRLTLGRHVLSYFGPTPSRSRRTGCEREQNERRGRQPKKNLTEVATCAVGKLPVRHNYPVLFYREP